MEPLIRQLANNSHNLHTAAATIIEALEDPGNPVQATVPPSQLLEGLEQFLILTTKHDDQEQVREDAGELGDYGINLIMELTQLAARLQLPEAQQQLENLTLSMTDWIMRHQGKLRTLEPVVDALANTANRLQQPAQLEQMATFIDRVIEAVNEPIKQDLEKSNPGRPWRILLLNRGIVATRSHNTALIEQVYDELVQTLPEEAAAFFKQAMQQMQALDYPSQVREVVQRYYDRFTRQSMH